MRIPSLLAASLALAAAQLLPAQQLPMGPRHASGQDVTAAFEGWFPNEDGTFALLFGYLNRNTEQELDIPIGDRNKIEPGGPDRGQPTHFLAGRNWGVFTVTVPKDFGRSKIVWTLSANGVTTQIPAGLDELWELSPFRDANGNTPPWIGFENTGPFINGPGGPRESLTANAGTPVSLPLWVADDAVVIPGASRPRTPPIVLSWSKFRGPGAVVFANARPPAEPMEFAAPAQTTFHGKAVNTFCA
jgi:hypothetical protein